MPQVQPDRHGAVAGQLRDADAEDEGRIPPGGRWRGGEEGGGRAAEGGRVGAEASHQSLRVWERVQVDEGAAVRGVRGVLAGRLRALRSMQGKIHNNMSVFAILAYVLEYFMSS